MPYIGSLSDIPAGWHLCDGTDGTPDLTERFLEGTSTTPGIFKKPGLPNITGRIFISRVQQLTHEGALWTIEDGPNDSSYSFGANGFSVNFNASWSNPIYGAAETVQPASYTVYYIIKVK